MAYASGAGGLNNPFNLCKPVVSSASLVGHVLYRYGQPRSSSGVTIASLSTNSGGALEIRGAACQQRNMGASLRERNGRRTPQFAVGASHKCDLSSKGDARRACMFHHPCPPLKYGSHLRLRYAIDDRRLRKALSCPGTTRSAMAAMASSDCTAATVSTVFK